MTYNKKKELCDEALKKAEESAVNTQTKEEDCAASSADGNKILLSQVYLRVYDLSHGMAKVFSKSLLGIEIDGVWHTSIEVYGKEYFFHSSLRAERVGECVFGSFVERIDMGSTECTQESFEEFFQSCDSAWNERTYDFLENNCNNFTNWVANFLVNKNIPDYILSLPEKVKNNERFKQMFYRK